MLVLTRARVVVPVRARAMVLVLVRGVTHACFTAWDDTRTQDVVVQPPSEDEDLGVSTRILGKNHAGRGEE